MIIKSHSLRYANVLHNYFIKTPSKNRTYAIILQGNLYSVKRQPAARPKIHPFGDLIALR